MEFLPYGWEFGRDFSVEFESSCHHRIFELSFCAVKKTLWSHLDSLQLAVAITVSEAVRRHEAMSPFHVGYLSGMHFQGKYHIFSSLQLFMVVTVVVVFRYLGATVCSKNEHFITDFAYGWVYM